MFLNKTDMPSAIYGYQIDQITEDNDAILLQAMITAVEEVSSYLSANNKKEYQDGRPNYDVVAIFNQTQDNRNPLILEHCKVVAVWWLVKLCNADVIYEQAKERYDRSINYLKDLGKGRVNISSLPVLEPTVVSEYKKPFYMGSRAKFNHE